MTVKEYSSIVIEELNRTLSAIKEKETLILAERVMKAKRIFVAGLGRSGYMMKALAMRLMHLGLQSYVVGESVTPNIERGDLLLIGSGSGETKSILLMAEKAKTVGATIALVTIRLQSSIGRISDLTVTIPAPTPKANGASTSKSIQPMASLFEQSLLLFLDLLILIIMEKKEIDADIMFEHHANLE